MAALSNILTRINYYMNQLVSAATLKRYYVKQIEPAQFIGELPAAQLTYAGQTKTEATTRSQQASVRIELHIMTGANDWVTALQTIFDAIENIMPKDLGQSSLNIIRLNIETHHGMTPDAVKGQIGHGMLYINIEYRHLIQGA